MSIPHNHIPPLTVRERATCMCEHGTDCSSFAPGHAIHLIQARLASATPSEWIDAVVESANGESGHVRLRSVFDATTIVVWSGAGASRELANGTPVALHGRYHVLANGSHWYNVLRDA